MGWGRPQGVCAVELPRLGLTDMLGTCTLLFVYMCT